MNLNQWASSVLSQLGIKQTSGAMQAMVGWARAEGGHWHNDARYNPLNTTQPMPGAGNTGSQGNIKVYKSWEQGVAATVKTLKNGLYGGILQALKSGNASRVASAIGQTPWGTGGGLVAQTIAAAPKNLSGVAAPISPSASSGSSVIKLPDTQQVSGPAVTPAGQTRQDLLQQYLTTRGQPGALLGLGNNLASLKQQTTTVPGATIASGSSAPTSSGATAITTGNVTAPKGTVMFEGKRVAAWIAPALKYARARGWKGVVASGFRTFAEQTRIYNSGVRPAARPGYSNHEGSDFPRGAVDVTDAATLSRILENSPYGAQLKWAGAKDPVHFSHPHNGSY